MKFTKSNIFFYSLIVVALLSPAQYCRIPLGNTFVNWFFSFCVVLLVPYISKRYNPKRNSADYFFCEVFLGLGFDWSYKRSVYSGKLLGI